MQLNQSALDLDKQQGKDTVKLPVQISYDRLLARMALRICQSLNLDQILDTVVAEVRQFLQTDRVIVYRFEPDWSGVVVVESVSLDWCSTLGAEIQDNCFSETYLEPYKHGRTSAIEDIFTANIAQCHIDLLARYQVRANLVVPILQGQNLWGLLIAHHCSQPRQWQEVEVDLLSQLATHIAIAIQQSKLYLFAQTELLERQRVEATLKKAKDELETKVKERTTELININQRLRNEIAERQQVEAALRVSEERYALAVNGAKDGLWDWNLESNEVYFSSRWKLMAGYREHEIDHRPQQWFNRVHPEDIEQVELALTRHLQGHSIHFESEYRLLHKDGTARWMLSRGLAVRDADGKPVRIAGCQTDITERKLAEQKLLHDAFHDPLTKLPNRTWFMKRLLHAESQAQQDQDYLFAILFVDLDRFKLVNDSLGHMIGDQLLVALVQRLKRCSRVGDTVARFGGDEFAILLEDIKDVGDAISVAERIQAELALPFRLSGHEVFTTASIGIVLSTTVYEQLDDLMRDADTAMYRAKAQGKARYQVFDQTMHVQAVTLLQLENELQRGVMNAVANLMSTAQLGESQFQLQYQPIVSLSTGRIQSFEALLRWHNPAKGFIPPTEFIPIAEETGLIIPLGYWVMHEACSQLRRWQEQFPTDSPLTISVNLSSKQFLQPNLIEQIGKILQETNLDGSSLKLEIAESVMMANAEAAEARLQELRVLGIELYVDNFGSAYSSLSYLQRFPVNVLKLEPSFVKNLKVDGEDSEIIQTILKLANKHGIDVVAKGVETAEQLESFKQLSCKSGQGQGYFFSQPLDSTAATNLIATAPQW